MTTIVIPGICDVRYCLHYLSRYEKWVSKRRKEYPSSGKARKYTSSKMSTRKIARQFIVTPQIPSGYPGSWGTAGELKAIDTALSSTAINTTEIITCINPCAQGSDIGQRVGREIIMKSVQLSGVFYPGGASVGDVITWSLVYDRQTNAAAPVWTDVYTQDSTNPLFRNLNNRKRFKVLGSGMLAVPKVDADVINTPFNFYRKLKHPVEFNATNGGTVADITTGGLFFMIRGRAAPGADDYDCSLYARVRFSDN